MNQAPGLQSLFARLAERGMACDGALAFEVISANGPAGVRLMPGDAGTLANIKSPPVVYAGQAKRDHGPQQINDATAAPSRARECKANGAPQLDIRT